MWKATEDEATELKEFFESRFDFQFVIRPVPGNRGFQVNAIRKCRCGQEIEQGDGFDKPAICEDCDRKRKHANLREATEEGEKRRGSLRFYTDFEEVCQ